MAASGAAQSQDVQSVPQLDLARYMGRWYEIARYPNRFQADCRRNVTADYRLLEDGTVEVVNRCDKDRGVDEAVGQARPGDAPGRLQVRFAPAWLSWVPWVWAPYWVIQLAPDYHYAVVSDDKREYLWILSRAPSLSESEESEIVARLAEQGFDTGKLRRTQQATAAPTH